MQAKIFSRTDEEKRRCGRHGVRDADDSGVGMRARKKGDADDGGSAMRATGSMRCGRRGQRDADDAMTGCGRRRRTVWGCLCRKTCGRVPRNGRGFKKSAPEKTGTPLQNTCFTTPLFVKILYLIKRYAFHLQPVAVGRARVSLFDHYQDECDNGNGDNDINSQNELDLLPGFGRYFFVLYFGKHTAYSPSRFLVIVCCKIGRCRPQPPAPATPFGCITWSVPVVWKTFYRQYF